MATTNTPNEEKKTHLQQKKYHTQFTVDIRIEPNEKNEAKKETNKKWNARGAKTQTAANK